jgi:hypothetical protein
MRDLGTIKKMHDRLPRPPAVEPVLELVSQAQVVEIGNEALQEARKLRTALEEIQRRMSNRAILTSGEVFAIKDIITEVLS